MFATGTLLGEHGTSGNSRRLQTPAWLTVEDSTVWVAVVVQGFADPLGAREHVICLVDYAG